MDTNRAIIFMGKLDGIEYYELLTGLRTLSTTYNGSSDREGFFEALSDRVVQRLSEHPELTEVTSGNGYRINPETHKLEKISKLEQEIVAQLNHKIVTKSMQTRPGIPGTMLN